MARAVKVLYVGPDYPGSNGTLWRNAFVRIGCEVSTVDDERLTMPPATLAGRVGRRLLRKPSAAQIAAVNQAVLSRANEFKPDLTFYIKAPFVLAETVEATRRHGPAFAYMNDDMFHGSATFTFRDNVKLFDCILTTKSFSVREYMQAGAQWAVFVPNSYDPEVHYPVIPKADEMAQYAADVSFIGDFSPSKADALARIAACGEEIRLNVWGNWSRLMRIDQWPASLRWRRLSNRVKGRSLYCSDMAKAIGASKISLGLLRRECRDLHTSRTFEIPACGGFMLAQRTEEHRLYFEEDREAVYFSTLDELIDKLRFYLAHHSVREQIAAAGYEKCLRSGATYVDRARYALDCFTNLRRIASRRTIDAQPAGIGERGGRHQ